MGTLVLAFKGLFWLTSGYFFAAATHEFVEKPMAKRYGFWIGFMAFGAMIIGATTILLFMEGR